MHPSPDAIQTITRWVRAAMAVEGGGPAQPIAAPTTDTAQLLAAVGRHRVVEVLHRHAAHLELPADVSDALERQRRSDRRLLAVRVLEIGRMMQVLSAADAPWLLVKGPALAAQTTGDPTARGGGDIDLFVAPAQVRAVCGALQDHGWSPRIPVPSDDTWAWAHILDRSYELTLDGTASTVDLHWRLDPTHDALPDFATCWARRVPVDIGGVVVDTLAPADAFDHACHHAAKDGWRWLRSLVDVHRLARQPAVWPTGPLSRVGTSTVRVTQASIGLPRSTPASVVATLQRVPGRIVDRAIALQEAPAMIQESVPGIQTIGVARYRLSASRSASDVRRTVLDMMAPPSSVADLDAASAWTSAPQVLWHRVAWFCRRLVTRLRGRPDASARPGGRP